MWLIKLLPQAICVKWGIRLSACVTVLCIAVCSKQQQNKAEHRKPTTCDNYNRKLCQQEAAAEPLPATIMLSSTPARPFLLFRYWTATPLRLTAHQLDAASCSHKWRKATATKWSATTTTTTTQLSKWVKSRRWCRCWCWCWQCSCPYYYCG